MRFEKNFQKSFYEYNLNSYIPSEFAKNDLGGVWNQACQLLTKVVDVEYWINYVLRQRCITLTMSLLYPTSVRRYYSNISIVTSSISFIVASDGVFGCMRASPFIPPSVKFYSFNISIVTSSV